VSTYRNVFVTGTRGKGRGKKTWEECVEQILKSCGLVKAAVRHKMRGGT